MKYIQSILIICLLQVSIIHLANAQPPVKTSTLLELAYLNATAENKAVLTIFHASWCSWCKKLDASLNDKALKPYFDKNYIIVHITVLETDENKKLENPGGSALLAKYKGENEGLPFFVLSDHKKKLIGTSLMNGKNIGCPASEKEVKYFIGLLKKSSPLLPTEAALITKRFKQNEVK